MAKNERRIHPILEIEKLIERIPPGAAFEKDEELAERFFDLSEDALLPKPLRDFCLELTLRARAYENGPLGLADSEALLRELIKRTSDLL